MQKIPTLFIRDEQDRSRVTDQVTPGCEWVIAGEGVATRKFDGTCVMLVEEGSVMAAASLWWARREVKAGKTLPDGFMAVHHDETTGKTQGWVPMEGSPFAKFHAEALAHSEGVGEPGTYELVGPKINGNPECFDDHELVPHGRLTLRDDGPIALIRYCNQEGYEGIVWHHPDGRMAKLKVRDYPAPATTQEGR